jgi:hypothetical protein
MLCGGIAARRPAGRAVLNMTGAAAG